MLVASFQTDYNWHRPHSSLGDLARAVFAESGGWLINPPDS